LILGVLSSFLFAQSSCQGSSLACKVALSQPQLRVAVAEASVLKKRSASAHPDCRVLALSPASVKLLSEIGVWSELEASGRVAPYYSMTVWDGSSAGQVSFGGSSQSQLGVVCENWLLQEALVERMKSLPNITLMSPDSVSSLTSSVAGGPIEVGLSSSGSLSSALVAGCDGASSPVAKLAGLANKTGWRYGQSALVCAVRLSSDEVCSTAYQRFLPGGQVLALLPMFDNFASIVWSTSPEHCRRLGAVSSGEFLAELRDAFSAPVIKPGSWLSSAVSSVIQPSAPSVPVIEDVVGDRASFPLQLSQASSYVGTRVALVGDAAHTMHPLAGQGFNLALGDVAALSNCLDEAARDGQDFGSNSVLQAYQDKRKLYNAVSLLGVDAIQKIFSVEWEPFVQARGGERWKEKKKKKKKFKKKKKKKKLECCL
jgi:ubiquinone biosynthesis UbiH/UbiF/VisC/COQ6 family hydroxylase